MLILILFFTMLPASNLLLNHLPQRRWPNRLSQLSLLVALVLCAFLPKLVAIGTQWTYTLNVLPHWALHIDFYFDCLTWVMLCLVSLVSLLIYSFGARYLLADQNQPRFLGQLTLLSFSVMLLMVSGSLLTAFIAWQFIGLTLYLLLNHYHYDLKANKAAKKKFIINRVGDVCFLFAVILTWQHFGSSSFQTLFAHQHQLSPWIMVLIFIAIMTKSAQFPFHIWLIDTMEAPTPVSALMHAGVINAGGFLLARLSGLYSPHFSIMIFICVIGLLTALLGNLFMRHQVDTKKQLAYSTMGQMGYMLLQSGLGCFSSAVFHLIAHGFFKGTMFLSSASTLKYRNIPPKKATSRALKIRNIVLSLILALLVIITGSFYFRQYAAVYLNPLIWLFIGVSLWQVFYTTIKQPHNWLIKITGLIISTLVFFGYLFLLEHLDNLLGKNVLSASLTTLGWSLAIVIIALLLIGYLLRNNATSKRLLVHKGDIETFYRNYLINPVRRVGDFIIKLASKLPAVLQQLLPALLLIVIAIVLFYFGNQLHQHTLHASYGSMLFSIIAVIIALLIANRATTLPQIIACLVFLISGLAILALSLGKTDLGLIGLYELFNGALVLLAFGLLLQQRQKPNAQVNLVQNRLPMCHFYMSLLLLLLIGIPGSASFISEIYLLMGLLHLHLILALCLAATILLTALVILHTLQVHFFNPHAIAKYATPVPVSVHMAVWLIILLNITNGVAPHLALHALSRLFGGA